MYRIGQFARVAGVSRKTLRFYDEIGLLRPAATDTHTRYRYYAPAQLSELATITALKELGMSLDEVKAIARRTSSRSNRRAMLGTVRARLERSLAQTSASLAAIDAAIARAEVADVALPVVVKRRPSVLVASLGEHVTGYDVMSAERELLGRVPVVSRGDLRGVLWHRCADEGTPLGEPFVELRSGRRADSKLDVTELPAVTAACAYSTDDYDAAEQAYVAIRTWMRDRRCALAGPKRELYRDGMLEIQFPIVVGDGNS
jgi:DNA-binding transcriptional MerR regulator